MHTDQTTIQQSVKAYLSLVLHMNEAQGVHIFAQSLKEHMSLLHQK